MNTFFRKGYFTMKTTLFLLLMIGSVQTRAADRPNIVFMLADDQGWNGLSVGMDPKLDSSRGSEFHTPNLEWLARQGMRFSMAYAPAPVCSPTRASIQTGRSPAALHWTKAAPPEQGHRLLEPRLVKQLSSDEVTVGELLRCAGYATAHYGKWHLGGGGPGQHGYDDSDGDTGNEQAFRFKDPNPVDIFGMADRAEKFMEQSSKAGKPFYIQLSWNALHASENANRATLARYEQKFGEKDTKRVAVAAMTEDLDTGVGRVLAAIDRLGLAENTWVIYTSDNGANGGRKLLHGGKGDVYEGGIRVPLIVRGPGIKPNSLCAVPVVGYDFLPTFCEWAGIAQTELPKGVEGGSLVPLFTQPDQARVSRPREELVFHFPHYQGDSPHSAILVDHLKLLHFYEDGRDELYDLARDPGERNDLAAQRPTDTQRLRTQLQTDLEAVRAQLPTLNPSFDPARPAEPRKRGGKNNPNKPGKK